jgi:hypothetical protein
VAILPRSSRCDAYRIQLFQPLRPALAAALTAAPVAAQNRPVTAEPHPIAGAVAQPFKDLGIVKDKVPDSLKQADAAPYEIEGQNDCAAIEAEISEFDKLLGPDVDTPEEHAAAKRSKGLVGPAIGKAIGLPFRSVVRALSGAEKNDQKKREAIEAGMARRAYLKGMAHGQGCGMHSPQVAEVPASAPASAASVPPTVPKPREALAETRR